MSDTKLSRLYYMDLLRGLLMLLGVVLHTLAIFSVNSSWKISSPESVPYAGYIISVIHSFRMPAFFIISGFFTSLILQKRSRLSYAKLRLSRLGIPLLFVGVAINIPISFLLDNSPANIGFMSYLGKGLWLGHLWFLSVLILYSMLTGYFWPKISEVLERNNIIINVLIIVVSILSYPILLRIGWRIDLYDIYLYAFAAESIFQYLPYFIIGLMYYFQFKGGASIGRTKLLVFITFISVCIWKYFPDGVVGNLLEFISSLMISFSIFSIMSKLMKDRNSPWIKKLADSSYTIYIIHQPIIILLGLYLINVDINVNIKILLILVITTLTSLFVHKYLVLRFNLLGLLLNGNSRIR